MRICSWRLWLSGFLAAACLPACQSAGNLTRGVLQAPTRVVRSVTSGQILSAPGNILRNVTSDAGNALPDGLAHPYPDLPEIRHAVSGAPATATLALAPAPVAPRTVAVDPGNAQ